MTSETQKTFRVAILLCLSCSVVVSGLAVGLKDIQQTKKEEFRQQSILEASGAWQDGADRAELWKKVTPVVIDLETNSVSNQYKDANDKQLDLATMLRTPKMHVLLESSVDVAGIKKKEKQTVIYELREGSQLKTLVLPIRGRGLWSTLYGFVALDMSDAAKGPQALKVAGLTYYKHGETPGLGGEVENKRWKGLWVGKAVYSSTWDVRLEVAKIISDDECQIEALSGATLTSNGVTNMLAFWLGENGFGPYLDSLVGDGDDGEPTENTPVADSKSDEPKETEDAKPEPGN